MLSLFFLANFAIYQNYFTVKKLLSKFFKKRYHKSLMECSRTHDILEHFLNLSNKLNDET